MGVSWGEAVLSSVSGCGEWSFLRGGGVFVSVGIVHRFKTVYLAWKNTKCFIHKSLVLFTNVYVLDDWGLDYSAFGCLS